MDEVSVKMISRKRKKNPQSVSQNAGILTRSKISMIGHRNRSGLTRTASFPVLDSPAEEFSSVLNSDNSWGGLSIKDLRTRRVFSPDVSSILEEQNEETAETGNNKLEDLGLGSGLDRISDICPGEVNVNGDRVVISELGVVKHNDGENGLALNDDPVSKSRTDLKLCSRKKVFKSPGSFSYRRLLPYLAAIDSNTNDSISGISKINVMGDGFSLQNAKFGRKSPAQNCSSVKVEHEMFNFDTTKSFGVQEIQSLQSGPCNQEDLSYIKSGVSETSDGIKLLKMDRKNKEGGGRVDIALEESVQMTPPDPDIFTQTGGDDIIVNSNTLLSKDLIFNGLSDDGARNSTKQGIKSINSPVLKPCSRLRVFSNPQSVSYRRLLPLLMEISNHNSFQKHKPVEDLKGISQPLSSASSLEQNQVNRSRTESASEMLLCEDTKENSLPETVCSFGDSSCNSITRPCPSTYLSSFTSDPSNVEQNLKSSENANPSMVLEFQAVGNLPCESSAGKMEGYCPENHINGFGYNRSEVSSFCEANHNVLNGTEVSMKHNDCLDMRIIYDDNTESTEKVGLNQNLLKVERCDTLLPEVDRPPKGILKKNPRGCRGSCDCLNCASFRLHAERAYEFSRNQMHDAEEVASMLMKEVAKLRCMLERSTVNNDNTAVLHLSLVKQACIESLQAEELAKKHLYQLNHDLIVHCRIPALLQPKVTFSNYIQERSFPAIDQHNKTRKTG